MFFTFCLSGQREEDEGEVEEEEQGSKNLFFLSQCFPSSFFLSRVSEYIHMSECIKAVELVVVKTIVIVVGAEL